MFKKLLILIFILFIKCQSFEFTIGGSETLKNNIYKINYQAITNFKIKNFNSNDTYHFGIKFFWENLAVMVLTNHKVNSLLNQFCYSLCVIKNYLVPCYLSYIKIHDVYGRIINNPDSKSKIEEIKFLSNVNCDKTNHFRPFEYILELSQSCNMPDRKKYHCYYDFNNWGSIGIYLKPIGICFTHVCHLLNNIVALSTVNQGDKNEHQIWLIDIETNKVIRKVSFDLEIADLSASYNGKYFAVAFKDGTIKIYEKEVSLSVSEAPSQSKN